MNCTNALERKIRDFTENNIAPRALQQNALPKKVTDRKPVGSVSTYAYVKSCNSGLHSRSQAPITVISHQRNPVIHIHKPGVCCPGCLALELENMSLADLPFRQAFTAWLNAHSCYISERSREDYKQYGNALCEFFDEALLGTLNIGSVRSYQQWRSAANYHPETDSFCKYRHHAGNVRIKNEINSVLKPMLREVGLWADIKAKKFRHLPVSQEGAGVALTKDQWRQIFDIAFSHKRWMVAGHCLQIMFRTGRGFGELRKLKRGDVDLDKGTIRITEGGKNEFRKRTVTLVPSALESVKWLVDRWHDMGGQRDDQYLLPHKTTIKDKSLNRPMASINFAWNAIKREWKLTQPKQARPETRQYDARVSAASLLLQNPDLSLATIEKALGWTPSSAMRKRYHRADLENQRAALATLEDAG